MGGSLRAVVLASVLVAVGVYALTEVLAYAKADRSTGSTSIAVIQEQLPGGDVKDAKLRGADVDDDEVADQNSSNNSLALRSPAAYRSKCFDFDVRNGSSHHSVLQRDGRWEFNDPNITLASSHRFVVDSPTASCVALRETRPWSACAIAACLSWVTRLRAFSLWIS